MYLTIAPFLERGAIVKQIKLVELSNNPNAKKNRIINRVRSSANLLLFYRWCNSLVDTIGAFKIIRSIPYLCRRIIWVF